MNEDRCEQFKAEESSAKWRTVSIILIVACVILAILLFVTIRNHSAALRNHSAVLETTRQGHMLELQRSLRGFQTVIFFDLYRDLDSATEQLRRHNHIFEVKLHALHIHSAGSPVPFQMFSFIRTDTPEILLENSREISYIIRRLIENVEPSTDTDYALKLILAARDEINQFFTEHDFEMGHRRHVEDIRFRIPHITSETLHFSGDNNNDALLFIVFHFMPFDDNIWALLAHHDEDFPEDLAYLMSRMSLVADDIFSRDEDDAREIAELIGQELSQLYDNLSPDMDLQTVLDLITNTMREIKEITPLTQ